MRPGFNLEPKYRATLFTREEWTRGTGTLLLVKWLVWFTGGSRTAERTGTRVHGQFVGRRLVVSLGKLATIFQVEVSAILACVDETDTQDRPVKFVSIYSDSQAVLKALQVAKPPSQLLRHYQKVLNDISTRHTVGLYWVPGHAGLRGNEIVHKLARDGSVQKFVGPGALSGSF